MEITTLQEAIIFFSKEENVISTLVNLRYPDGKMHCPHCDSIEHWYMAPRKLWKCKSCRKQFTLKVGTIMEDSHISLDKWLCAIWMLANSKNGVSSYEISRSLGMSQSSSWFLLHRIRSAMQEGSLQKLSGTVEVDETFVGGKSKNMHSKRRRELKENGGIKKTVVLGILERDGVVKTQVIPNVEKDTLQYQIHLTVKQGSNLYTDAFPSYKGLNRYKHESVDHKLGEYVRGDVHTNGIENYWSLFKRGIHGTYIGVSPKHLQRYSDEQAFRFNERKKSDVERFAKVVSKLPGKRLTFDQLKNAESEEWQRNQQNNAIPPS